MKEMKVKITFLLPPLGTSPADPNIYENFVGSKAPNAATLADEVEALGVEAVVEKGITVFPHDENGNPFLYDYQVRGFFKGACGALRSVPDTRSSKIKAYKKKVDQHIFVNERQIPIVFDGGTTLCQRPLRAQTMQGERVGLASSEEIPAGATCEFTVKCLIDDDMETVREWLNYGELSGIGQWRNSGRGRFTWEEVAA